MSNENANTTSGDGPELKETPCSADHAKLVKELDGQCPICLLRELNQAKAATEQWRLYYRTEMEIERNAERQEKWWFLIGGLLVGAGVIATIFNL